MKFITHSSEDDNPGWHTDDTASIYFYRNAQTPTPPRTVIATIIGFTTSVSQEQREVETASLEFISAGLFGPPRGEPGRTWSGDCYKFGIYQSGAHIVIIQQDGSGTHPYLIGDFHSGQTWNEICSRLTSELLWDLCLSLTYTYRKGREDERTRQHQLLLAGKLKKRRHRGVDQVIEMS